MLEKRSNNGRTRASDAPPLVVIVGAGFAGLTAVKALRRARVRTLLIDRHNYHLFTPLLYQVATALLNPSEIAQSVRSIIRPVKNAEFRLALVKRIELDQRQVDTDAGTVTYDYLILSAGSHTNYFGNEELRQNSYDVKDLAGAARLRNRILAQFEAARWARDPAERKRLLTFVVVGGGATGVEFAGALAELINRVLRRDFRHLDLRDIEIHLVEASDKVLAPFAPRLEQAARRTLEHLGIRLVQKTEVKTIRDGKVSLGNGHTLTAGTVIWAAGVKASDLGEHLGQPTGKHGTVKVEPTLQLPGYPEVFIAGDMAAVEQGGKQLPMLAPVAMQEARLASRNLRALVNGKPLRRFHYRDKGIMATVGRNAGIAQAGKVQVAGFLGWLAWLMIHLLFIIGFRRKLFVLLSWAWNYLSYDRPIRLILWTNGAPSEQPAEQRAEIAR
ncbi:MAG: NAD(P)/FAD-dependent oxidoreductase [Candidatus Dormibacter sp.]